MNVNWIYTLVTKMLNALTLLGVTTALVCLATLETAGLAVVISRVVPVIAYQVIVTFNLHAVICTPPCHEYAECTDSGGSPTCVCTVGFTGNGDSCTGME